MALGADKPVTIPATASKKRIKLGLCTYSYWHFAIRRCPLKP